MSQVVYKQSQFKSPNSKSVWQMLASKFTVVNSCRTEKKMQTKERKKSVSKNLNKIKFFQDFTYNFIKKVLKFFKRVYFWSCGQKVYD